jgi:GT2 family glycosyltransferase
VKVSAVVVNYNGGELVDRCIGSLYREPSGLLAEIILVDNASRDGSLERVEHKYPGVKILKNEHNLGFAKANNQGIAVAGADAVLLLNNAAEVGEGAVRALADTMERNPRVGIVGPRLRNPDGTLQYSYGPFPSALRFLVDLPSEKSARCYDRTGYDEAHEVQWLTGACLLIRKRMLDEIGGLDEAFFFNFEDVDLCKRARAAGWRCCYAPQAEAIHHRGSSILSEDVRERIVIEKRRSQLRYFRKHAGAGSFYLMKSLNLAYAAAQWLRCSPRACLGSPEGVREQAFYRRVLTTVWGISRQRRGQSCVRGGGSGEK